MSSCLEATDMHLLVGLGLLLVGVTLIRWLAARRVPADAAHSLSRRRVWILPRAAPARHLPAKLWRLLTVLGFVHDFLWAAFFVLLLYTLVAGPIRPIHEWLP